MFLELRKKLVEDMAREYSHWHFYQHASIVVSGLARLEYKEFFEEQAKSEMEHIKQFGIMIQGLGGNPTMKVADLTKHYDGYITIDDVKLPLNSAYCLLQVAAKMEAEVVQNYAERMLGADDLAEMSPEHLSDALYIHAFIENQLLDSKTDLDEINLMLVAGKSDAH